MTFKDLGSLYLVSCDVLDVRVFNDLCLCSPIPERRISFQFQKSNGDLVDIRPDANAFDGEALRALSQDAQAYGELVMRSINLLRTVRDRLGRRYKEAIRTAWLYGSYQANGLEEWDGQLQSVRNSLGPAWLDRVRI